jgi:hypothetical protein
MIHNTGSGGRWRPAADFAMTDSRFIGPNNEIILEYWQTSTEGTGWRVC